MSLINDALKRVSSQGAGAVTPPPIPGVIFNDATPERSSGHGKTLLTVGGILVAILVIGTFLLQTEKAVAKADPNAAPAAAKAAAAPAEKPAPSAVAERLVKPLQAAQAVAAVTQSRNIEGEQVAASVQAQPASTPSPAAKPVASAAPKAAATPAPAPRQKIELQAIYYRLNNPTAVINGKTVREGDLLAGGKIAIINRNSVELDVAGSRKVVRFE